MEFSRSIAIFLGRALVVVSALVTAPLASATPVALSSVEFDFSVVATDSLDVVVDFDLFDSIASGGGLTDATSDPFGIAGVFDVDAGEALAVNNFVSAMAAPTSTTAGSLYTAVTAFDLVIDILGGTGELAVVVDYILDATSLNNGIGGSANASIEANGEVESLAVAGSDNDFLSGQFVVDLGFFDDTAAGFQEFVFIEAVATASAAAVVSEPSAVLLFGLGILGLVAMRRRVLG